jgi:hypothetical protein
MNDISKRLKALKSAWKNIENRPNDLAALGLPGKDSRYIEETIDELARMAAKLGHGRSEELVMTRCLCESLMTKAEAYFSPETTSTYPSMRMLSFVALLQQMQTTMKAHLADPDKRRGSTDRVA